MRETRWSRQPMPTFGCGQRPWDTDFNHPCCVHLQAPSAASRASRTTGSDESCFPSLPRELVPDNPLDVIELSRQPYMVYLDIQDERYSRSRIALLEEMAAERNATIPLSWALPRPRVRQAVVPTSPAERVRGSRLRPAPPYPDRACRIARYGTMPLEMFAGL